MSDEKSAGSSAPAQQAAAATATDIARLRRELQQLQSLLAMADALIVVQDGKLVFHNPAFAAMVTYRPDQFMGAEFVDFVHPDDRLGLMRAYLAAMAGDGPEVYEFRSMTAGGAVRCYRIRARRGEWDGRPALLGNITERSSPRLTETKYQHILDVVPAGVFELDLDNGRFLRVNDQLCEMLGYTRGELMALSPFDLVVPEDRSAASERRNRALQGLSYVQAAEYRIRDQQGRERWALINSRLIRHDDGTASTIDLVQDITEHKLREAEVRRVDKLESLGVLAGGIAHDFNNLLTAILGNVTIGRRRVGDRERVAQVLEEVERACLRASNLTQQLLTFSQGGAPIKRITAIEPTLRECATLAVRGSKARCSFDVPQDLWSVDADEGQIGQVITNLAINAEQAMPQGGEVVVVAANLELADGSALPLPGGRYVHISIADRGVGIAPEHLASVFDPYFTTKPGGSGLGLATAYSIMQRHGGHLTVDSSLGAGTVMHLYLPASDQDAPAPVTMPEADQEGSGRILLMDDEEVVRELGAAMLTALGYQATVVPHGDAAIAEFVAAREAGTPFDAVVLDLTIGGGRGGRSTISELLRLDPDVRALVMSGYSNDPVLADPESYGFQIALNKPFTLDQMGAALAELLVGERRRRG